MSTSIDEKTNAIDGIIGSIFSLCSTLDRDYNIKSIALFHHVGVEGVNVDKSVFFRGRDMTLIRTDMNQCIEPGISDASVIRYSKSKQFTISIEVTGTIGLSLNGLHIQNALKQKNDCGLSDSRLRRISPYVHDVTEVFVKPVLHSDPAIMLPTMSYMEVLRGKLITCRKSVHSAAKELKSPMRLMLNESPTHIGPEKVGHTRNTKRRKTSDEVFTVQPHVSDEVTLISKQEYSEPPIISGCDEELTCDDPHELKNEIYSSDTCLAATNSNFEIHSRLFPDFHASQTDGCTVMTQSSNCSLHSLLSQLDHYDDEEDGTLCQTRSLIQVPSLHVMMRHALGSHEDNIVELNK